MDRWVLTIVCLAGMAVPATLIVRFGASRVAPESEGSVFRSIVVSVESGLLAGVLAGGLGARFFMRIAAAISPERAQGLKTEARETVGAVTLSGTMFLVLFIGLFGGPVLGLLYRVVRRHLHLRASVAGIAVVAIPAALLGRLTDLSNPDSVDFFILGPKPLIALLIGAYIAFAGAALGAAHEWLEGVLPPPSRRPRAIAAYAPALAGVIAPTGIVAVVIGGALVAAVERTKASVLAGRIVGGVSAAAALFVVGDLVRIAV